MKTKHVESLEDMVFRNKNKLYGAYSLRKKYNKYLTLSLILALFLIVSGLVYPVIASIMNRHKGMVPDERIVTGSILLPPPPEPPAVTPPPPPPPADPVKSERFTTPSVVPDSIASDFGKQDELADNKPLPPSVIEPDVSPVENKPVSTIETGIKPPPATSVQVMPSFPGGDGELFAFLKKTLKYPPEAKAMDMTGTVYVSFVVEIDGSITEVSVARGVGSYCDEEALRVVKSMPSWIPGRQNNIPVRVRFNLPVKFIIH